MRGRNSVQQRDQADAAFAATFRGQLGVARHLGHCARRAGGAAREFGFVVTVASLHACIDSLRRLRGLSAEHRAQQATTRSSLTPALKPRTRAHLVVSAAESSSNGLDEVLHVKMFERQIVRLHVHRHAPLCVRDRGRVDEGHHQMRHARWWELLGDVGVEGGGEPAKGEVALAKVHCQQLEQRRRLCLGRRQDDLLRNVDSITPLDGQDRVDIAQLRSDIEEATHVGREPWGSGG